MSAIQSIARGLFFCCLFVSRLSGMREVVDFLGESDLPLLKSCEIELKEKKNDEELIIIDKPVVKELGLAELDRLQNKQKSFILDNGQVFVYSNDLLKNVMGEFATVTHHGMRTLCRYVPKEYNEQCKPQIMVVVHGTSGRETKGYYDYQSELFHYFLKIAGAMAREHTTLVDCYSYEWSGENSDKARINAGKFLGRMLNAMQSYYAKLNFFPHSHGLGPVLSAANSLLDHKAEVLCNAMGSPILEGNHLLYAPHVKRLLNFTSQDDEVQWLGYWWSTSYENSCKEWNYCKKSGKEDPFSRDGKKYRKSCHGLLANIHFWYDTYAPAHSELPLYVAKYYSKVVEAIAPFEYEESVLNLAVTIMNVDERDAKVNVMLYPQTYEERGVYLQKLPEKMFELHSKNVEAYKRHYGFYKQLPFEESYWTKACAFARRMRKLTWSI